ncbi:hypothetical protein [Thalassotalea sp. PS06]|uniref:hypothetical protein n=1 Tax=Thalassotalea sp. PS06 TaxID=2594005 RepID=UPI0011648825|nr:hypothetical protein [Thalassotalea sp. PS06]QDP01464.1 hypothetical protein FNC98_09045 [Thalassotalea sp. PS06]
MDMRIHLTTAPEQQYEIVLQNSHFLLLAVLILGFAINIWGIIRQRRQHWLKKSWLVLLNLLVFALALFLLMPVYQDSSGSETVNHLYTSGVNPTQVNESISSHPKDNHWLTQALIEHWHRDTAANYSVETIAQSNRLQSGLVNDLSNWYWQNQTLEELVVHGHGFTQQQYQLANIENIQYRPADLSTPGFRDLQWRKQVYLGQNWSLSGQIQGKPSALYNLEVTDPGGEIIAQVKGLRANQTFSTQLPADVSGHALYQLSLYRGGAIAAKPKLGEDSAGHAEHQHKEPQHDEHQHEGHEHTEHIHFGPLNLDHDHQQQQQVVEPESIQETPLSSEQLAVSVIEAPKMTVLMMQSSPSFETRHLKNLLQQQEHGVITRTRISQERFLLQHSNLEQGFAGAATLSAQTNLFDATILANVDVLLIDGRMVEQLDIAERQSLLAAIKAGLGVIVLMDNQASQNALQQLSGLQILKSDNRNKKVSPNATELYFSLADGSRLAFLNHQANRFEFASGQSQILIENPASEQVAMFAQQGQGRITLTSLTNAYQWQLSSNRQDFQTYWQYLMQVSARVKVTSEFFPQSDAELLSIYENNLLCVLINDSTANGNSSAVDPQGYSLKTFNETGEGRTIPLRKKQPHLSQYCGVDFPQQTGWQQYTLTNTDETVAEHWRYVYPQSGFSVHRDYQKHLASKNLDVTQAVINKDSNSKAKGSENYQPMNKFWIWLALIITMGYLWFERKKYLTKAAETRISY